MLFKRWMRQELTLTLVVISTPGFANHDLAIELVEVTGKQAQHITTEVVLSEAPVTRPTHDAGELLRSVTGMTALRRGGRGFDPIIRGQSQSNLNIISNGSFNYGACPGRMDPATTYVNVESFDSVQVIKGHRSVVYGPGGSGGTLLFEHIRPEFDDKPIKGNLISGYTSNSDLKSLSADVAVGGEKAYLRTFFTNKDSDNYEDGSGDNFASSFDSDSFGVVTGIDLTDADYLELSYEKSNENDIWYAGNGMDAVFADSKTSTFKWHHQESIGVIDEFELTIYRSDVEHLMDNYSVRNRNTLPNGMSAPSSSDTWGGQLITTANTEKAEWRVGVDYRANQKVATLYRDDAKDGSLDALVARMWPDTTLKQTGFFAELDYRYSKADDIRIGIRYNQFESSADDATLPAGMMGNATPTNLYQQFYSTSKTSHDDQGFGLVLGWDHDLSEETLFSLNLSRSMKTPDATEQWIARSAGGSFWVGNPDLDAEIHQQIDLTLIQNKDSSNWSISIFYDHIDDYIERYRSGSANLYRNIQAKLYGIELDASYELSSNLNARLGASYIKGRGDNGNLSQISPLELRSNLEYSKENWSIGIEWILSDSQTHFNPDLDVPEKTRGFGVIHAYGHWNVTEAIVIEAGIENLFDNSYAYHVNSANLDPFNPDATRVNEPGRQIWTKLRYRF